MTPAPYLSLVLACYNEAEHLEASFAEVRETLEQAGWPFEVIFVDDASRDRTPEILRGIVAAHPGLDLRLVLHEANRGRGATVTDGFRAARGEIAGYIDVDLEVHPRYIPSLVRAIEKGKDIATVRRIYAFQPRSLDRYAMSRGYSLLVRLLLGLPFHDTETGYKFFRRERVLPLLDEVRDAGWFWTTEPWHAPPAGACRWRRSPAPTCGAGTRPRRCGASATRSCTSGSSCGSVGSSRRKRR